MNKSLALILSLSIAFVMISCGGGSEPEKKENPFIKEQSEAAKPDPKGIGETRNVELTDPMDAGMIATGKGIYEMKCSACHKLTDQRVVGPGWAGVTNSRRPEWIMNMITNVDVMLEEDPEARKMLEECLTRMPNQGVSTDDARGIVEFMRNNDVEQVGSKDGAVN